MTSHQASLARGFCQSTSQNAFHIVQVLSNFHHWYNSEIQFNEVLQLVELQEHSVAKLLQFRTSVAQRFTQDQVCQLDNDISFNPGIQLVAEIHHVQVEPYQLLQVKKQALDQSLLCHDWLLVFGVPVVNDEFVGWILLHVLLVHQELELLAEIISKIIFAHKLLFTKFQAYLITSLLGLEIFIDKFTIFQISQSFCIIDRKSVV